MNETNTLNNPNSNLDAYSAPDAPWTTSNPQERTAYGTSMPDSENHTQPAAADMLNSAVQGAHGTIDRLAESAEPAVRKLGDSVAAAGETLHAKADQLRETGTEWAEGMRSTVRSNPLASLAAALALGAVIARLTR